jgi:hypothetical protein
MHQQRHESLTPVLSHSAVEQKDSVEQPGESEAVQEVVAGLEDAKEKKRKYGDVVVSARLLKPRGSHPCGLDIAPPTTLAELRNRFLALPLH